LEDKQVLLNEIAPQAVLKALTPEAKKSIIKHSINKEIIGIWELPINIGRESRTENHFRTNISEQENLSITKPGSDIYLIDNGEYLQISRQHLQIKKTESGYILFDTGSACGTFINDVKIGGDSKGGSVKLSDGDIIKIGTEISHYLYKFITLK
jgi:pSer/pThr/pTyr-binding forkhead associated (FHA) protein